MTVTDATFETDVAELAISPPILFDHREVKSGIPRVLAAAGLHLHAAPLPAGDYVLSDRLVVERKTGADLAASIKDRRLFEQIERLREAYPSDVLLVEGEPIHIAEASWKGALGRVLTAGVSVLRTADRDESAAWLAQLHRLEVKGAVRGPRASARRHLDRRRHTRLRPARSSSHKCDGGPARGAEL